MSSGRIAQHRNYGELMERHERDIKLRRIVKIFVYFLIILSLIIMFAIVRRFEQKKENVKPKAGVVKTANVSNRDPGFSR